MAFTTRVSGSNPARFFLLFGLFSYLEASVIQTEDTSLIQLHVLWRHGNRTRVALDTYQNDPFKNIPDPEGVGNLNQRGKLRAHQLGQTLRERYNQFLGENYLPQVSQVRSTQKRRAMDSAQLVMAGLYPPSPNQRWTSTGNEMLGQLWQPTDIIIEPLPNDNLLANVHLDCPKLRNELNRIQASEEVRKDENRVSENGTVFEYVSSNAGEPVNDSFIAQGVHNALLCEEDQGWDLPEWTKSVYPEPLRSLAGLGLGQFGRTRLSQKLIVELHKAGRRFTGPLLNFIISSSERLARGDASEPKFIGYSGHDNNIVTILAALGLTDLSNTMPKYSAHMAWEVRRSPSSNNTYVRVLYEGKELLLPGCDFKPLCTLQQLKASLADVIITREQHWKECKP